MGCVADRGVGSVQLLFSSVLNRRLPCRGRLHHHDRGICTAVAHRRIPNYYTHTHTYIYKYKDRDLEIRSPAGNGRRLRGQKVRTVSKKKKKKKKKKKNITLPSPLLLRPCSPSPLHYDEVILYILCIII